MDDLLAIPRISRNISLYSRQHDQTQCALVSRAWNKAFSPHLWTVVKGLNLRHFQTVEARAALVKYAHLIRILKTSSHEFLTYLGAACQNLAVLDFSGAFPLEGHEDGYLGWNENINKDNHSTLEPVAESERMQQLQKLDIMSRFILQNKGLEVLNLRRRVGSGRYTDKLLTDYGIFEGLPCLKELTISSTTLHSSALAVILGNGHRLERLTLMVRQIEWQIRFSNQEMATILQQSPTPWKLQDLLFGPVVGLDIGMIVKAAGDSLKWLRLERLSLYEARGLSQIVKDHCPNLEHVMFMTDHQIDKNGLMLLLDAIHRCPATAADSKESPPETAPGISVARREGRRGLTAFQGHALIFPDFMIHRLFSQHYDTLDMIDLSRCQGIQSATIQQILCSCPNLRVVDMASEHLTLETRDIVRSPPWVCRNLEILQIEIASSSSSSSSIPPTDDTAPIDAHDEEEAEEEQQVQYSEMEMQRLVLRQIGSLSRLKELRIGGSHGRSLDLRLEENGGPGLELLSRLKMMLKLNIVKMGHCIEQRELEWIVRHWPMIRLYMFKGYNPETVDLGRLYDIQNAIRRGES
ncbi:hypothetical protein BG004_005287 [Podila humilis]|nr:hypothetical protein BG004_005287 [Podila humilis]